MNFDKSIKPGPKSVVWSFDTNAISIVQKLYANIYPQLASQILSNQVYVSHTFRKYSTIQWHGKTLVSNLKVRKIVLSWLNRISILFPRITSGLKVKKLG